MDISLNGDQLHYKCLTTNGNSKIYLVSPHLEFAMKRIIDFCVNKTGDSTGDLEGQRASSFLMSVVNRLFYCFILSKFFEKLRIQKNQNIFYIHLFHHEIKDG